MRIKELYVADDGSEHSTAEECLDHEAASDAKIRLLPSGKIFRALQNPPDGTPDFVRGYKTALAFALNIPIPERN